MTILSFAATFAGLGLVGGPGELTGYGAPVFLVLGVFVGSALWWLLLSSGVGLFRVRLSTRVLHGLNRISGLVLLGFCAWSLAGLLRSAGR